jgi:ADP-ribose pyrophosphatase YjhB (NUDIX family)
MKTEYSAGGIVVRKKLKGYYVLVLKDMSSTWTFPKGIIEKNEKPVTAARREIAEETGVTGLIYKKTLGSVEYDFHRNGKIHKIVRYYMFTSDFRGPLVPQKEEGVKSVKWMRFTRVLVNIGYRETNIPMLQQVARYLDI